MSVALNDACGWRSKCEEFGRVVSLPGSFSQRIRDVVSMTSWSFFWQFLAEVFERGAFCGRGVTVGGDSDDEF